MSKLYVNNIYSKTGAAEAINIQSDGDVSFTGNVLTPNRIHVRVIGDGSSYVDQNAGDPLPMTVIQEDGDGNGASYYNTSTRKFTAPLTGIYLTGFSVLIQSSTAVNFYLYKDTGSGAVVYNRFYQPSNRGWFATTSLLLNAGDVIYWSQGVDSADVHAGDGTGTYSHVFFTHLG